METNILIVDDEENIRMLVAEYARRWGYTPFIADGVAEAIKLLEFNEFQIILTDQNMPSPVQEKTGGIYLTEFVRKRYPASEVIMITGFCSIESAIDAIKAGAFDYIAKPVDAILLKEKIDRILDYKKLINPVNTIPVYKNIYTALLHVFKEKEQFSPEKQESLFKSLEKKIDYFFRRQKQTEHFVIVQHEALSRIAGYAEQLNEIIKENDPSRELLDKIIEEASKRL